MIKPASCAGCPLAPIGAGFMRPSLATHPYGVALIGPGPEEDEAEHGKPFLGRAGFRLSRLIEFAGFDRSRFDVFHMVACRPPAGKLDGMDYELPAIEHCRTAHWSSVAGRSRVLVPMGNVASGYFLNRKGILSTRGYVYPGPDGSYVVPTVDPTFISRGQHRWSAAFINDLQKAVHVAQHGLPVEITDYVLDPTPQVAYQWAKDYLLALQMDPRVRLAFDIETPGKGDDEEDVEVGSDSPDRTWIIERIGFSYEGSKALSIPFIPEHLSTIRALLGSAGDKIVWNAGFDVPRIRRVGVVINGTIHDAMVAWHILHSDLPKSLKFVATFTVPWQPAWKHLSGAKPAFYNATDADVELRSMEVIERELKRAGLWDVYVRDVIELEPILVHMSREGMPIDEDIRLDRAVKLADKQTEVLAGLESLMPAAARRVAHVYINPPPDTAGLLTRAGKREIKVCSRCGAQKPPKAHFKRFVKKLNPCSEATAISATLDVEEFYRLAPFTPSRDQLTRYHQLLNRPLPMTFDQKDRRRKVCFAEKQMKELAMRYPLDPIYSLVLDYREIDKLAGTYVGRVDAS